MNYYQKSSNKLSG